MELEKEEGHGNVCSWCGFGRDCVSDRAEHDQR